MDTVGEQLVYEMGDPDAYITPDCVVDFTSIQLEQAGRGPRRGASESVELQATDSYKVSISYLEGYKSTGQLTISGPDAMAKAKDLCRCVVGASAASRRTLSRTPVTEYVGANACHGEITPAFRTSFNEVVLRVGVRQGCRS